MNQRILLGLGLLAVMYAAAYQTYADDRTTVGVSTPEAEITVTTDQAAELAQQVVESSLRGVGRMLGAMRGSDPGRSTGSRSALKDDLPDDVKVHFDAQRQRYSVTTTGGPQVWIDAQSGTYDIDLQGATDVSGVLIEESLATVGSMIRGLRTLAARRAGTTIDRATIDHATVTLGDGPLGLSALELSRLKRIWHAEGVSEAEIRRRQENLETADLSFRASMRQLDESMEELDHEMHDLEREMRELRRQLDSGGDR